LPPEYFKKLYPIFLDIELNRNKSEVNKWEIKINKLIVGTTVGGVLVSIDFFFFLVFYFYRWNLVDLLSSLSSRG